MFKFQENKIKIVQNNFQEIKTILIKKERFIGKATGHNHHHMINMGGKRLEIVGN